MTVLNKSLQMVLLLFCCSFLACGQDPKQQNTQQNIGQNIQQNPKKLENMEIATFGAGCFWCVEAVFQRLEGVEKVVSGYCNGTVKNPTYKEVCDGTTGHAEVCQITFDPKKITYDELLEVFWQTHDPTTLNQQGADRGTQYRSAIFYHNETQKALAEKYKKALETEKVFDKPVVTEITAIDVFYNAEDYHQNYYNQNKTQGYCAFVIAPKVEKLNKVFKNKLKK